MSCREFEDRLEKLLDGQLSAAERLEAEEHRTGCARCRELAEIACTGPEPPRARLDAGLTAAILERTGGDPCATARERIPDLVDGALQGTDAVLLRSHLTHCDACRRLGEAVAWVGEETATASTKRAAGPELTGAILARTSGPACEAARDRIPDRVDGVLGATDGGLVDGHLAHCRDCSELAMTVAWMAEELPGMAEVQPDAWFVQRVLGATSWQAPPAWTDRIAGWWSALLKRPRLAWEAPYVGAMVLLLLFGSPLSPLRDVPGQALAMVSSNPVRVVQESPLPAMGKGLVNFTGRAWDVTGGKLWNSTRPMRGIYSERLGRVWEHGKELGGETLELWTALFGGDMDRSAEHLREIGRTLMAMWEEITGQSAQRVAPDRG